MQTLVLQRLQETPFSTRGELRDPAGAVLCGILERGLKNPAHWRIPAGTYALAKKPFGSSHFDRMFKDYPVPGYSGILWLPDVADARAPAGKRQNIEIHTANLIQQLEGCLATGDGFMRDSHQDFMIDGGKSKPAFARIYPILSAAIDAGGAMLEVRDIPEPPAPALAA